MKIVEEREKRKGSKDDNHRAFRTIEGQKILIEERELENKKKRKKTRRGFS